MPAFHRQGDPNLFPVFLSSRAYFHEQCRMKNSMVGFWCVSKLQSITVPKRWVEWIHFQMLKFVFDGSHLNYGKWLTGRHIITFLFSILNQYTIFFRALFYRICLAAQTWCTVKLNCDLGGDRICSRGLASFREMLTSIDLFWLNQPNCLQNWFQFVLEIF